MDIPENYTYIYTLTHVNPQNWDDCEILYQQMMIIIIEPTFHPSTCDM